MLKGSKATYVNIAIQREEALKEFDKANELKQLENEYEKIISNSDQMLSLDELEADIKKLNEIINNNIKIKLVKLQENQKNDLKKLEDVSSLTATCPTCRQEIKNENMINALKIGFKRNINELADNIENLKQETQELLEKRNNQIENYKLMKTPEMQDLSKKREILKEKIDNLYKEKNEIDLSNRETMIKNNQIIEAKRNIENITNQIIEITKKIEDNNKKVNIASKLEYLTIHNQMEKVKKHLKNVSIELYKYDDVSQEYVESYEIRYNGKLYEQLSKSYKLRADIEIAGLINKVMKIDAPMFIDDVESITSIDMDSDTQTILSIVVKYNELEVFYSYSDVLLRERDSVNKKIEEISSLLQVAA